MMSVSEEDLLLQKDLEIIGKKNDEILSKVRREIERIAKLNDSPAADDQFRVLLAHQRGSRGAAERAVGRGQ